MHKGNNARLKQIEHIEESKQGRGNRERVIVRPRGSGESTRGVCLSNSIQYICLVQLPYYTTMTTKTTRLPSLKEKCELETRGAGHGGEKDREL